MGLRINTNVQSLSAQQSFNRITEKQRQTLDRLSTGSRINKAADDAAGLAISENLKAGIRSSFQATRNANDGISLVQTAEGGMNEVANILIRLRELSTQAASDTIGENERQFSDLEFKSLTQEVDRIANSTTFNGRKLLSGVGDNMDFQVGVNNDAKYDRLFYTPDQTDARAETLGIGDLSVSTKIGAQSNLEKIDEAISKVNANRARLGALQNRLSSTISNLEVKTANMSEANSRIRDADVAEESANLARNNILSSAGLSVLAQSNTFQQGALKLIG